MKVTVFFLIAILILSSTSIFNLYFFWPEKGGATLPTTTVKSINETIHSPASNESIASFLDVGELYSDEGYPEISVREPIRFEISKDGSHFTIGILKTAIIGLKEALEISSKNGISPENYRGSAYIGICNSM